MKKLHLGATIAKLIHLRYLADDGDYGELCVSSRGKDGDYEDDGNEGYLCLLPFRLRPPMTSRA